MNELIDYDSIFNISIFGSYARGEADKNSDLDIMVILNNYDNYSTIHDKIERIITLKYHKEASISRYSKKKIVSLFRDGDLFAWHLFLESKPLFNFSSLSELLNKPNDFKLAFFSVTDLLNIYDDVKINVIKVPENIIFEAGISYVCLRNVAMCASWEFCAQPIFSRNAPFMLEKIAFPLTLKEYETLSLCRLSGQRGFTSPVLQLGQFLELFAKGRSWILQIKELLNNAN